MHRLFHPKFLILLSFSLLSIAASAQAVTLDLFMVKSEGANVKVVWELFDESGITEFRLFRKVNEGSFQPVTTLHANGSGRYTFMDDDIFKNESQVLTYELQVMKNGRYHKFYTTLSHNPTAIQRTWGSIKSMFK